MDCFDGKIPDIWVSCDFSVVPNSYLLSPPRSRTWRGLFENAQSEVNGRVGDILNRYRPDVEEVRSFLENCDERCLLRYLDTYLRKKKNSAWLKVNLPKIDIPSVDVPNIDIPHFDIPNNLEEKLQREIDRFFSTHPKAKEILDWYEKYKEWNISRRDIIKHILVPVLEGVEKKTGIIVWFVPIRGGFITLVKDGNRYHGAHRDTVISWSSVKQVLSGFGSETAFFQVVDNKWRVIWTVETPASRALEAMMYIDQHRSIWETITKGLDPKIQIIQSHEWQKITLTSPNSGLYLIGSYGEGTLPWMSNIRSLFTWAWVAFWSWSDQIRFGGGIWNSMIWGEQIHAKQLMYTHSVWLWGFTVGEHPLDLHWLWNGDIRAQGKQSKVETAKWKFSQSLVLPHPNAYLWVESKWQWTPDLLGKKYYDTRKSDRILLWAKYQEYTLGISTWKDGSTLEWWIQDKNTACTFSFEYQRKVHELLESTKTWSVSCVKRF
jgi:hypothetical protein